MGGRVKTILTIGEDAAAIAAELEGVADIEACGVLATAVFRARTRARRGDVVLLSPACASYDQFRNFEDRGDQFKALVRGLAGPRRPSPERAWPASGRNSCGRG